MYRVRYIWLLLTITINLLNASVSEYQEIYQDSQREIDRDYLTQYSELLYNELKDDFNRGLDQDLDTLYQKLQPTKNSTFESTSLKDKVALGLGIMELYLKHIDDILKDRDSKYDAISLLQYALKEHSLISKSILKDDIKTPIRLSNNVPIDMIYLTSWVDRDGVVEFRDDIYGYDRMQK